VAGSDLSLANDTSQNMSDAFPYMQDLTDIWNPDVPVSHTQFLPHFRRQKKLGDGGDGVVFAWRNIYTGDKVAIKTPRDNKLSSVIAIEHEIKNLRALGKHENIASILAFSDDFQPFRPAIFLQVCDCDLHTFHKLWIEQQKRLGKSVQIPENTVWKLFHDMILGLDFMHNGHKISYVHNDFKPENILVLAPPSDGSDDLLPVQPIFKITDFARLTMFPTPEGHAAKEWTGTYEYAPPRSERYGPTRTSVDIWGLGATIQAIALDILPTQTKQAFIDDRVKQGFEHPHIDDDKAWHQDFWRIRRPVVFRPLNVPRDVMRKEWDVGPWQLRRHKPYSDKLSMCYEPLLDKDPIARITAADLKEYVLPLIEAELSIRKERELAQECLERASRLHGEAAVQKAGREAYAREWVFCKEEV
jgi:serine/threonine protein kinase